MLGRRCPCICVQNTNTTQSLLRDISWCCKASSLLSKALRRHGMCCSRPIPFLSVIFLYSYSSLYPFLHLPTLAPSCVTTKRVSRGRLSDVLTIILMQGSHSSSGGGEPRGSWGRLEDRGRLGGRISPSSGESVRIWVRCEDVRV